MEGATICRHFLAGKCNYADCRFSHDVDGATGLPQMQARPSVSPASSNQICRHFLRGTCNVADCRFSHGGNDLGANLGELGAPAAAKMQQVGAVSGSDSLNGGGPPLESSICRHFLQGKCTYGANCRFPHGDDAQADQAASDSTMLEAESVSGGSTNSGTSSSICRHWLEGKCNYATCRFSHGDVDLAPTPVVSPRPTPTVVQRPVPTVAPSLVANGIVGENICRHFLQGKCEYGDLCRFPHAASNPMQTPGPAMRPAVLRVAAPMPIAPSTSSSSDICRHFLQGRCDRGAECRFSHGPQPAAVEPLPAANASGGICRHFLEGKCTYGDGCRFSHGTLGGLNRAVPMQRVPVVVQQPAVPAAASSANICRHFLEGKCTMGAACRFSHGTVPVAHGPLMRPAVRGVPQPNRLVQAAPMMPAPAQDERNICRHFLRNRCEMGDDCAFLHPGVASKPVCAHWLQGKCNYGDTCQFRHPKKLQERLSSICVQGIPLELDEAYVVEYFEQFGPIAAVDLKRNADGTSKGTCNVVFGDSESVLSVMSGGIAHELNGQQVDVRKLEIPEGQIAALTQDYSAKKNISVLRRSGPY